MVLYLDFSFSFIGFQTSYGYLCLCSISKNSMYNLLQPHLDTLLFEIVFPLMCFNDNDQMLWDEDPHEYVRKGYGM